MGSCLNFAPGNRYVFTLPTTTSLAAQACSQCKRAKRKCDKVLPSCALCKRLGRSCDYYGEPEPPGGVFASDELLELRRRVAELEARLPASGDGQGVRPEAGRRSGQAEGEHDVHRGHVQPSPAVTAGGRGRREGGGGVQALWDSDGAAAEQMMAMDIDTENFDAGARELNVPLPSAEETPARATVGTAADETPIRRADDKALTYLFLDSEPFPLLRAAAAMTAAGEARVLHGPLIDIPVEVLAILSNTLATQEAVADFFATIHPWFPILHKQSLFGGTTARSSSPSFFFRAGAVDPGLAALAIAMALVVELPVRADQRLDSGTSPSPATPDPLHTVTKRFLSLLETSGYVALPCLQAMVLVALYEVGHAIYPAAWMTVGGCVRYGEMLGGMPPSGGGADGGPARGDIMLEERMLTYGAIYVLDGFVSLGGQRGFCCGEKDWVFDEPSTSLGLEHRSLNHLVKGAILMRGAMATSTATPGDGEGQRYAAHMQDQLVRAGQLESSLAELSSSSTEAAHGLAQSASIILLETLSIYSSGTSSHLRTMCLRVRDFAVDRLLQEAVLPAGLRRLSPLCLHGLYRAARALKKRPWHAAVDDAASGGNDKAGGQPGPDDEAKQDAEAADDIRLTLMRLSARWRLAGEYAALLERQM